MAVIAIVLLAVVGYSCGGSGKNMDDAGHRLIPLKLPHFTVLQSDLRLAKFQEYLGTNGTIAVGIGQPEKECRKGWCCYPDTECCSRWFCCREGWKGFGWWCAQKNRN